MPSGQKFGTILGNKGSENKSSALFATRKQAMDAELFLSPKMKRRKYYRVNRKIRSNEIRTRGNLLTSFMDNPKY